jgi:hypothetical protein
MPEKEGLTLCLLFVLVFEKKEGTPNSLDLKTPVFIRISRLRKL